MIQHHSAKRIASSILLCSLSLMAPLKSLAWGAEGHRIIAEMAMSLLSPKAGKNVLNALGTTVDSAAVWMDVQRSNWSSHYKYMKDWHFVNIEPGATYAPSNNDVVYNLQRVIDYFDHLPAKGGQKDTVQLNLKVLFHLMGDITQPLHCGYLSDRGGNEDSITITNSKVEAGNLHAVWDGGIIKYEKITVKTSLDYYHTQSPAQLKAITTGDTKAWMMQSRSYLPNVYACKPATDHNTNVTTSYLDSNKKIVQQQMVYAAVRLANVLERDFGK